MFVFLFCTLIFRHGTASHDSYNEDMYRTLLESYQQLQQEMASVAAEWQECEKRIDDYVDEQVNTSKTNFTHTDPGNRSISENAVLVKGAVKIKAVRM